MRELSKEELLKELMNLREYEKPINGLIADFEKDPSIENAARLDEEFRQSVVVGLMYNQLAPQEKNLVDYKYVLGLGNQAIAYAYQDEKRNASESENGVYTSELSVRVNCSKILKKMLEEKLPKVIREIENEASENLSGCEYTEADVKECIADYNYDVESMQEWVDKTIDTFTEVYTPIMEGLPAKEAAQYIEGAQSFLCTIYHTLAAKEGKISIVRNAINEMEGETERKILIDRYHNKFSTIQLAEKYHYSKTNYGHDNASGVISELCTRYVKRIAAKSNKILSEKLSIKQRLEPALPNIILNKILDHNKDIDKTCEILRNSSITPHLVTSR